MYIFGYFFKKNTARTLPKKGYMDKKLWGD